MAVADLCAAAARYEALGFTLTPFSAHSGAWKPGDPVTKLGAGNRCAVFARNYLEILAAESPERPAERIERFLARHQGAHIICFGTDDPDAVDARLRAAGLATSGVIPLQRDVDTREGVRTAKFRRTQFAPEASPEGYIQAAHHLTPEHIHQARYVAHPTGVTELADVFLVVDAVRRFAARYQAYLGAAPAAAPLGLRFALPLGAVTIVDVRDAARALPGSLLPPVPGIAGVSFRTPALAAMASRLADARIRFAQRDERIVVPAEEAFGLALVFEIP
jgi:hypothetical protein